MIQACRCGVEHPWPYLVADVLQLMATGEPSLVAGAAALLETVLRHDSDALPWLYTTGAFFFALAYCGSNLLEIARLLRVGSCRDTLFKRCSGPADTHIRELAAVQ